MDDVYKLTNISHLTRKNKNGQPDRWTLECDKHGIYIRPGEFAILRKDQLDSHVLGFCIGDSPLAELKKYNDPMQALEDLKNMRSSTAPKADLKAKVTEGSTNTDEQMQEEKSIADVAAGGKDPFSAVAKHDAGGAPESVRVGGGEGTSLNLE